MKHFSHLVEYIENLSNNWNWLIIIANVMRYFRLTNRFPINFHAIIYSSFFFHTRLHLNCPKRCLFQMAEIWNNRPTAIASRMRGCADIVLNGFILFIATPHTQTQTNKKKPLDSVHLYKIHVARIIRCASI